MLAAARSTRWIPSVLTAIQTMFSSPRVAPSTYLEFTKNNCGYLVTLDNRRSHSCYRGVGNVEGNKNRAPWQVISP